MKPTAKANIAPALSTAIRFSILQQVIIIMAASSLLDGGAIAQICLLGSAASWTIIGLILVRRRLSPTKTDLALVNVGYLLLCILSGLVAAGVWQLQGK